jgi:hypothetical protein
MRALPNRFGEVVADSLTVITIYKRTCEGDPHSLFLDMLYMVFERDTLIRRLCEYRNCRL